MASFSNTWNRFWSSIWSWLCLVIFILVGLASLNLFNNYYSSYIHFPGDCSNVIDSRPFNPPGSGSSGVTSPDARPPGSSSSGVTSPDARPPGSGSSGITSPDARPPGGLEAPSCMCWLNFWYALWSVIGAIIGGFVCKWHLFNNNNNNLVIQILSAFIGSRAVLYLAVCIMDCWC